MIVLGTHVFDLVQSIMGKPEWCMADITVNGKPAKPSDVKEATEPLGPIVGNRVNAMFGLGKGIAMFFGSIIQPDGDGKRWGLDIYGSKGVIKTRLNGLPPSVTSSRPLLGAGIERDSLPDAPS